MDNTLYIIASILWSISIIICIIELINTMINIPYDKFIKRNKQLTKASFISVVIFVILALICIW